MNDMDDFIEYCLRRLGKPVINIEVAPDQLVDRVEEAISVYTERHFDATEEKWVAYKVTEEDCDNGYITLPDDILTVVSAIPASALTGLSSDGMFSYQYQIIAGEFNQWQPFDMLDYFMKMWSVEETRAQITVNHRFRHVRHEKKLTLYYPVSVGQSLMLRVYRILDQDSVWNDRWLRQYATALIKSQWADNVNKFTGVTLLGGVEINGERLKQEAEQEIEKLERQLYEDLSEPVGFLFG